VAKVLTQAALDAGLGPDPTLDQLISVCPRIVTRRWLDAHQAAYNIFCTGFFATVKVRDRLTRSRD